MKKQRMLWALPAIALALILLLYAGNWVRTVCEVEDPIARSYNTPIYTEQGGDKLIVGSGGEIEVGSDLTMVDALFLPGFADETITDGETLTPSVTVYALDSGGAVTMTLAATGTEGQLLYLIADDTGPIVINDTNIRTSDGSVISLGAYDVVGFIYQDSEWVQLFKSANS